MQDSTNPYAPSAPSTPLEPSSVPALAPPQTVRYAQTAESLATWNAYRTLRNPHDNATRQNVRRWIVLLMIPLGLFVLWQFWPGREVSVATRVVLGGAGLVFLLLLWNIVSRIGDKAAIESNCRTQYEAYLKDSPNRYYLAPQTLTIDSSALRFEKQWSQSVVAWPAIERIEQTDDYLYLYLASFVAEIIPRSAFATQEEFLGFANLTRQLWEAGRGDAEGAAAAHEGDPTPHA